MVVRTIVYRYDSPGIFEEDRARWTMEKEVKGFRMTSTYSVVFPKENNG